MNSSLESGIILVDGKKRLRVTKSNGLFLAASKAGRHDGWLSMVELLGEKEENKV